MRKYADLLYERLAAALPDVQVARVALDDDPRGGNYIVVRLAGATPQSGFQSDRTSADAAAIEITAWARDIGDAWSLSADADATIRQAGVAINLISQTEVVAYQTTGSLLGVETTYQVRR